MLLSVLGHVAFTNDRNMSESQYPVYKLQYVTKSRRYRCDSACLPQKFLLSSMLKNSQEEKLKIPVLSLGSHTRSQQSVSYSMMFFLSDYMLLVGNMADV